VVIATPTGLTGRDSQLLTAPLLLVSPEYDALKLNEPVALKSTLLEFGTCPLDTLTMEATFPKGVQAPFPKTEYLTLPLAWKALLRVAESATDGC